MRSLIRVLKTADRALAALELGIALAALALILIFTSIPIALRAFGGGSGAFWWTTPLSLYLLLWATFLGASLAMRSRRHIQIDLVTRALPRRVKAGFGVLGWLAAAAILAILCAAAIHYVRQNWDQVSKLRGLSIGSTQIPDVPLGPLQLAMPIALAVMAFRCALAWLEDLRGVVTGDLAYLAAFEHVEGEHGAAHAEIPPPPASPPDHPEGAP